MLACAGFVVEELRGEMAAAFGVGSAGNGLEGDAVGGFELADDRCADGVLIV